MDSLPSPQSVLILGGTSDIGVAVADEYLRLGHPVILAARDTTRAEERARSLRDAQPAERPESVRVVLFEAGETEGHRHFWEGVKSETVGVVCAVGLLGDQEEAERDWSKAREILTANYVGCVSILDRVAETLEERGAGFIVGISSVAGDRGRASNYLYGSAKAGFSAYLSGLRNRLSSNGVQVLTVKPGFVRTSMTRGMDLPTALTSEPDALARRIVRAQRRGRNVVYASFVWWWIMAVIRAIPEGIFKRMEL